MHSTSKNEPTMALKKEQLKRSFKIEKNGNKITLPDPDPSMSPDQVMMFYSNTYPELATSSCHGPVYQEDNMVYTFKTTVGTKG